MNKYFKIREPEKALVKIRKNYQITLPRNLCHKLNLSQGDFMEAKIQDGFILMMPIKVIQPNQKYFFTKQWQDKEAEVDEEIRRGDIIGPFENSKDAIKYLKTPQQTINKK